MPIEIKELHVRVTVAPPPGGGRPAGAPGSGPDAADARASLVAECVDQVLQVLRDQRER